MEDLGHAISAEDITIGNDRIKAISELPDPKNSKELGSFFGYYRFRSPGCSKRFRNHCALGCWVLSILYAGLIQTFKKSLRPWLNLPRSNFWKGKNLRSIGDQLWGPAQSKVITQSKEAVSSPTVLHFPDFSKEFVVHVDASKAGVGAFLAQNAGDRSSTSHLRILA